MEFYLFLTAPPVGFALSTRLSKRPAAAVRLSVVVALALYIGLRHRVGCDWYNYRLLLGRVRDAGLPEALAFNDPGYILLNWLAAKAGLGIHAVNLAVAAMLVAGLVAFVRVLPRPGLALAIATPVLIAIVAMSAVRQAAAVGTLLWLMARLLQGREKGATALVLIAILLHWSAAAFLPLLVLLRLRRPLPMVFVVAAGAAAGTALAIGVTMVPFLSAQAERVPPASGALIRSAFTLIALVVLAVWWRRLALTDQERRLLGFLGALGLGALALAPVGTAITDRIGYYAVPLQMIVFTRAVAMAPSARLRATAALTIALMYLAALAGWLALGTSRSCMVPYWSLAFADSF